ncbi:uncharacterized protein [Clytia hemisphaerica]|uniref:uncharacterized protein n=1 Tax=Clytia hemisphaerica TaxID=252671 RepID=UPI0034D77995
MTGKFVAAIFIFGVLKKADAVKCYTCSTLGDPQVCKLWQEMEDNQRECVSGSRCLTISYKESHNGGQRPRFVKKCSNPTLDVCDSHCKNVKNVIPNTCRTSCCSTNLCNEEVNEKYIWYAFNTGKSRSNSANTKHMKNDLVTFCLTSVSICWLMYKINVNNIL